jgi:drug/metabolite transporter (DMT)-like permease
VWSVGALNAKLADDSDAWQYLVWRSVGVLVVMEIVQRRRSGGFLVRQAFTTGRLMIVACAAMTVASVSFIYALKATTAANAVLLASSTPLIAVVLARLVLGERLTAVTLVAIAVAFVGLLVMVRADAGVDDATSTRSATSLRCARRSLRKLRGVHPLGATTRLDAGAPRVRRAHRRAVRVRDGGERSLVGAAAR